MSATRRWPVGGFRAYEFHRIAVCMAERSQSCYYWMKAKDEAEFPLRRMVRGDAAGADKVNFIIMHSALETVVLLCLCLKFTSFSSFFFFWYNASKAKAKALVIRRFLAKRQTAPEWCKLSRRVIAILPGHAAAPCRHCRKFVNEKSRRIINLLSYKTLDGF